MRCRATAAEDYHAFAEFTAGYGKLALQTVAPRAGERLLDDACGPGHIALHAATTYQVAVDATDFSDSMIETARKGMHATEGATPDVTFHIMDGLALEFPDDRFDVVFSCFGVFLFDDAMQGLREMWRVAKPGGRVALVAWTTQEQSVVAPWFEYFREHAPELMSHMPAMPNAGVMDSAANMEAALRSATGQDAVAAEVTRTMRLDSPEKWVSVMLNNPFMSNLRGAISPEHKAGLAQYLGEKCRSSEGGVVLRGTAVIGCVNASAQALREAIGQ